MFQRCEAFAPRPVQALETVELSGWRIKRYTVRYPDAKLDVPAFDAALRTAATTLPQPAAARDRPGVGFAICHAGRGMDYLVLNWWGSENEYFNRVWVRGQTPGDAWREAGSGEAACVWDLELIWFERQAYVRHVLAPPGGPDVAGYLAERFGAGEVVLGEMPRGVPVVGGDQRLEVSDPNAYRDRLAAQIGNRDPLDVLAETPDALDRLVSREPADMLRRRPFDGKWTPLEIIGHLLDGEWIFGFRTRTIFADDRPDIVGIDQDLWVAAQRHNEAEPRELLAAFRALRGVNVALWRRFSPAERQRVGIHRERGAESIEQILRYAAGHDLWHQDQFQRYVAAAKAL